MIAHILKCAELNITAFMGGISANYNSNILLPNKTKDNNIVVVEADEYDKSFLTLNPDIEVITSMDADHLDIYGTQENLKQNFNFFLNKLKPDGKVFIKKGLEFNGNAIHYALKYSEEQKSKPDVYAENIRLSEQNNYIFDYIGTQNINDIKLHVNGLHNIENMIAAIAVAQHLGVQNEKIKKGAETYLGVKRRFEYIINNKELIFIDDYAHHPEEIRTTINAIRQLYKNKKLLGIFQPHLFSRTRDFADDFANSLGMLDELILLDIYPARELPIEGINSKYLLNKISLSDKQLYSKEELLQNITNHHFDIILTIGAGDIDKLIEPLKNKLLEKLVLSNA
jgi:UDP-N-acetylmuramate--alanine ligase